MSGVEALNRIVTALDACVGAADPDAARAAVVEAFKDAQRADKALFAPLKSLVTAPLEAPPAAAVLQRAAVTSPGLAALVKQVLRAHPRDLWLPAAERVQLKGGQRQAVARFEGRVLAAFSRAGTALDVFDLTGGLDLAFSVKLPGPPLSVCFTDASTLRALFADGRLLELKRGSKKPALLAELGELQSGFVAPGRTLGVRSVTDEAGSTTWALLDGERTTSLEGVASAGACCSVGGTDYVCVAAPDGTGGFATVKGGKALVTWLPRYPSGGTAPPRAESAHQFVGVEGTTFLVTWGERAPTARRWLRLPELVEDERFGEDFEGVDVRGGVVWSSAGRCVRLDGASEPPLFERVWSVTAVDDDQLAAVVCDAKDKLWLTRYSRVRAG